MNTPNVFNLNVNFQFDFTGHAGIKCINTTGCIDDHALCEGDPPTCVCQSGYQHQHSQRYCVKGNEEMIIYSISFFDIQFPRNKYRIGFTKKRYLFQIKFHNSY